MFQIISFLLMLQCLQNVIAILIWVKPTTLNYEANIACYKTSEVRRVFGAASLNRELVTIGRAVKMGNRRHAGPLCTNIRQNLRECDQNDPKAFIQITDLLSREMVEHIAYKNKQFEYDKLELCERKSPFVIGFNIEPSAIKIFHAQPSSPIAKEILIGCFNFAGSYQNFNFASAYNNNFHRSISVPIYEPELISDCTDGNIYISCVRAANYINMGIPQHLFLQYNEFSYDILSRTIEVGVNASTGQNEISNSEPVEVGVNASTGQNEASTSSVQSGDVHGISPTNNHLPSTDSEEKFNLPPCSICFDKPLEIAFIPCGHFISCRQCANKTGDFCPICRQKIKIKQPIIIS